MEAGPLLMVLLLDGGLASHWNAAFGGLASLGSPLTWVIGNEKSKLPESRRTRASRRVPAVVDNTSASLVKEARSHRKLGKCGGPAIAESDGGRGLCAADHGVQPASY